MDSQPNTLLANSLAGNQLMNFREFTSILLRTHTDIAYDFYTYVPSRYKPLYQQVRYARYMLNNYFPGVHNKLLASNVYANIVSLITNTVVHGGLKLDMLSNQEFLESLEKVVDLETVIREASWLAEGLGWSYIKLDLINGLPKISALANDQAYVTDTQGKLTDFYGITNFTSTTIGEKPDIFLIEHRYYKKGVPYIKHDIKKVTNRNAYGTGSETMLFDGESNSVKGLSKSTVNELGFDDKEQLSAFMKEKQLPFPTIGVEVVKSSTKNPLYMKSFTSQSNFNRIGIDTLIKYDTTHSAETHEISTATRLVLVPQEMSSAGKYGQFNGSGSTDYTQYGTTRPIQHTFMMSLPYSNEDGEKAEPKSVEFSIRSSEIATAKAQAISDIAFAIGFNKEDVLNIKTGSQYEKSGKGEKTSKTIDEKRKYLQKAFLPIIKQILFMYGIEGEDLSVIWLGVDLSQLERKSQTFKTLVDGGMMSRKYALKQLYPNLTKMEQDVLYSEIIKEKEIFGNTNDGQNEHNDLMKQKKEKDKE
jgi:hypothetical protein